MRFIDAARLGRNSTGLYIGGIAVLIVLFILGGLPLLFDAQWRLPGYAIDIENPAFIEAYGSTRLLVGELLSFFFACVGFVLYLRYAHQRALRSIFTAASRFRWQRFFGFGIILFSTVCLFSLLEVLWSGQAEMVQWNFKAEQFWPLFFFSLLLIPFQAGIEELVFRVYALQGLYMRTKSVWLSVGLSSAMFALMHISNPEIAVLGPGLLLYYFMAGLFLALGQLGQQHGIGRSDRSWQGESFAGDEAGQLHGGVGKGDEKSKTPPAGKEGGDGSVKPADCRRGDWR